MHILNITVNMNCSLKHLFRWKNDKQIELRSNLSNPRYIFSVDFTKLDLKELRQDDSGTYKCSIENKYGKVEHVMTVEIYGKSYLIFI